MGGSTTTQFYEPKPRPTCPSCGCEADAATGDAGKTPRDGDASFCLYCGVVRAFVMKGEGLVGYRIMTDEEIAADPDGQKKIAITRAGYARFLVEIQRKFAGRDPATLSEGERQILKTAAAIPAPTRVGNADEVSLTGQLFAWRDHGLVTGEPVLLAMPNTPCLYLACFTSEADLRLMHTIAAAPFDRIKQVQDGREFLSSIPPSITVILNPRITPEGRVRFTQILRA